MIDTIDKLKALTLQGETTEVEFKSARGGLPASMWETYSAFANTNGGTSICRNPILQKMFMRLGRAEKAGSGVDKIVSGWEEIGWPVPQVTEEFHPDYVILTMPIGKNAVVNEDVPHKYSTSTPQVPLKYPTSTPQVPHKYPTGTLRVLSLVKVIDNKELSIKELMELVNLKDRKNFMNNYLNPAIQSGFVEPIYPNQANHPKQKYRLTKIDINNNE